MAKRKRSTFERINLERMNRRQRRELRQRLEKSDPGLEVVHPNAAGIDVGNQSHFVAVPGDRDAQSVREFGCWTSDVLSGVLSGGSDAQRAVVPQRKLSPAPPPSSLAAWQRARRRWRRYAVPELRHDCGVSSVVWGSRVPADALLLTGSRRSADAGHRRRAGGRADRLLVCSQAAAQARS